MPAEADRQAAVLAQFVAAGRHHVEVYGMEWGDPDESVSLKIVRDDFLLANLRPGMTALEIGSGGGRWSRYFIGRVNRAVLVDATEASEAAIRQRFDWPGFKFALSPDGGLPEASAASIDFAFSFDTFVHFDRELFDQYAGEVGRVLKIGGKFVLHYARRWPDGQPNETHFKYREDGDVARVLRDAGVELTGKKLELRGGCGSMVVEAVRKPKR
jgi:SAM-dependent methyltransferase